MPGKHQPGCPCQGCGTNCYSFTCGGCKLPYADLTLSWVNALIGNGSTTLSFNGLAWTSACTNGLTFELLCTNGNPELRVIYYTAGACPTGTQQYCSNIRSSPFGLTLASYSCDPLSIVYNCRSAGCPTLTNGGYTQFTITGPQPQITPPGTFCCIQVQTNWCGCVAPGTITVTVQKGSAEGAIVCQGVADANGNFICAIPSAGTYYFSASTSAGGYLNVPVTAAITKGTNGACSPSAVGTVICPDQLTASGFWGALTVKPMQPSTPTCGGQSPFAYSGTIDYSYGGSCGCGATTVPISICILVCTTGAAQFTCSFPSFPLGGPNTCPGNGPGGGTAIQGELPIGTASLRNTCYPVNLSGTVTMPLPIQTLIGYMLGVCGAGPWSFEMAVTQ